MVGLKELVWEDLGGRDQYIFNKPNPNLKNSIETKSDPASSGSTASPSTNKKKINVMHNNRMPSVFKFGFSTKVTSWRIVSSIFMMMILNLVAWVWGVIWWRMTTMYHCWRCLHLIIILLDAFFSNNLTSPADDSEEGCGGENLLGDDVECEDLADPDGYYKALGCKKMSSDDDIGVAPKKAKKGFFGLGRTRHPDKTEDKEKIELFKKAKEQYKLQKTAFETLGTLNLMGNAYADRVIYDRKGGKLRSKFTTVFEELYPNSTFPSELQTSNSKLNGPRYFPRGKQRASRRRIWMHCKMLPIIVIIPATKTISPAQLFSYPLMKSTPVLRLFVTSALKCKTQQSNLGMA